MSITVKECVFLKEWSANGRSGKVYTVNLTDGTTGQTLNEIPVGTAKEDLEIVPNGNFPAKIKLIKKNGGFGGKQAQRAGNESFALAYARDVAIAMLPHMEKTPSSADLVKVIIANAEVFYTWMEGKAKK